MKRILLLFFFIIIIINLYGDLEEVIRNTDVTELNEMAVRFYNKWKRLHDAALLKAEQRDIPIFIETGNGFMELSHFDNFDNPIYHILHNANAAITISTDQVHPGGGAGLSLTGDGILIREWDGGAVRGSHQELTGRTTNGDGSSLNSNSYHSTHVGGTIIASGVQAAAKGMAFEADLKYFDWNSDTSEMATEAALGALVSNHSYGFSRGWVWLGYWAWYGQSSPGEDWNFGHYNSYSQEFDEIAYDAPYYLIVESAGNDRGDGPGSDPDHPDADGPYDCVADMAVSKNVLTVGAVEDIILPYSGPGDVVMSSFSSWGPCDDGRIKPDISANGTYLYSTYDGNDTDYNSISGTSMAAPSVTGSLALIQEHHEELYSSYLRSSTLKALTIHCADEAGSNDGPDYAFGWGLMNTQRMAEYVTNKGTDVRILEQTLSNGGSYEITLPSNGIDPFKATICWTDPEGTPVSLSLDPADQMLVNDLDIRITKDASTYYPWRLDRLTPANAATNNGDNSIDNIEQVFIDNPIAGNYTITITHKGTLVDDAGSTASQQFALIISGIEIDYPDPEITVAPLSYSESLCLDASLQSSISITNDGEAGSTLSYEILILESGGRIFEEPDLYADIICNDPLGYVPVIYDLNKRPDRLATTLAHHNDNMMNAIGTGSSGSWICAARFTSTELSSYYTTHEIQKVSFYITSDQFSSCQVKVWEGGSSGDPGTEIYSQSVTSSVVVGGWTEHSLFSPIQLISGNEYWIGYSLTVTGGYPSGADTGPMVPAKGAWMYYGGSWQELTDLEATLDFNWGIEMEIDATPSVLILTSPNGNEKWAIGSQKSITWTNSGPAVTNVKLELSTDNGANYSDIVTSTTNDGLYEWTVTGSASENCLIRISDASDSNINDISNANFRLYETVVWLTIDQESGSLEQYQTDNPNLTFNASGLSGGTYNADIAVLSNDSDEATFSIPVLLTVTDNCSFGSGNNGDGTSAAIINLPTTNIAGTSVDPVISIDPAGTVPIIVNITVTDNIQSSTPVPNEGNVVISYLIEVSGNISNVQLDLELYFTGLTGLEFINWLNDTTWEIPGNVIWDELNDKVSCNITIPSTRDGSIEIILSRDNPLPVSLSSFTTQYISDHAEIYWITQSEVDNLGWNIYRSYSQNLGQAIVLNAELIPGAGTTSEPTEYEFIDNIEYLFAGSSFWYFLESVDLTGLSSIYGPVSLEIPHQEDDPEAPHPPLIYGLHQNYPNPFNPNTQINFYLAENTFVEMIIYNIKGEKVTTLISQEMTSGPHFIVWKGIDTFNNLVGSGIYFCVLKTEKYEQKKKMILLK